MKICIILLLFLCNIGYSQISSIDKIAEEMVKSLKDNHCLGQAESALYGAFYSDSIIKATEIISEKQRINDELSFHFHLIGGFVSRKPKMTSEEISIYMQRFRTIDIATVEKWRTAISKGDDTPNSPAYILGRIAFHDFLFSGGNWKKGNPEKALVRLGSIDKDSVLKWKTKTENMGGGYGSLYDTWALLAVDKLFINDIFQISVFNAALPTAQKLISTK